METMVIPLIDKEIFTKELKEVFEMQKVQYVKEQVTILENEQPDIYMPMVFIGLSNPYVLMGFIIAYNSIKETMKKIEIEELNKMVR